MKELLPRSSVKRDDRVVEGRLHVHLAMRLTDRLILRRRAVVGVDLVIVFAIRANVL